MTDPVAKVERARSAAAREAWDEAAAAYRAADASLLEASDLEAWADATWWLSSMDESIGLRQRAYAAYSAEGDHRGAGWMAARLCIEHFLRGEPAVGAGWLGRTQRHARDLPDCVELGYVAMLEANVARLGGDLDGAFDLAERAVEIEHRFGDPNLLAMALQTQGLVRIDQGQVARGLALLDEAMTSVIAGEVNSYYTGAIYCQVIDTCLQIADVGRAGEWSRAASAWVETVVPESPFPGICRVNRAHLARLQGAWDEAGSEARRAAEELIEFNPPAAGAAMYEAGEVRRRIGDLAGAEADYARARELGFDPQPGLALLRLAQGKVDSAATTLDVVLSDERARGIQAAPLLAARVEVALQAGELDDARTACETLRRITEATDARHVRAVATTAEGTVRLAEGDAAGALERLRSACEAWQELKLPYEHARARQAYGLALRAAGDEEDARLELQAALGAFERLGATPDATATSALLGDGKALPGGLTAREAEVLRLVASGKTNRDIAVELVISEHTVARHLQNMFTKLDVSSRAAATAYAFEHGLT
ncbi:MAG TPA: LuxR C-terminal-related transcriptional regulator [Actinomycetota bacterium]